MSEMNMDRPQVKSVLTKVRVAKKPYPQVAMRKDKTRYCVTLYKKNKDELYSYWKNFSNFSNFMKDIESVTPLPNKLSLWKVKLENGIETEWMAETTIDVPGREISWRSTADSEIKTSGTVWFAESTNQLGSVVGLSMDFHVPGGKLTDLVTKFIGEDPKSLSIVNLKRFKALVETGEVPTINGQSDGREGEIK